MMINEKINTLLLVGIDLVGLAYSAKKAGHRVCAVDYFGDIDLQNICDKYLSFLHQRAGQSTGNMMLQFNPNAFVMMTKSLNEIEKIDGILLSSGLDDSFNTLSELNGLIDIIGNHPEVIYRVRDKESFFNEIRKLKISHPKTVKVMSLEEAKSWARNFGFPVILKSLKGFSGFDVRKVDEQKHIEETYHELNLNKNGVIIQEYIKGRNVSISFISSTNNCRILTFNEQLLGLQEVYQSEPFGYCGNVVPMEIKDSTMKECESIASIISTHFGLMGSNGIDFVISDSGIPYLIEVNPRFQGTLECVERILNINLVKIHIDACIRGVLPKCLNKSSKFATRLILYAPKRLNAPDLTSFMNIRDVPLPGSIIEKGEPLCSVISEDKNRSCALRKAYRIANSIYKLCT
jgi:predicted ATP-grasp superfamily ATP-dependent carboligase